MRTAKIANSVATSSHELWTAMTHPPSFKALQIERPVAYEGEKSSPFSFFLMFTRIIFRCRGSVLPMLFVELVTATALGFTAWFLTDGVFCHTARGDTFCLDSSTSQEKGHAIIGVLLSFLVVFRSQIAWGMYWEGRAHIGAIVAKSRSLALEILSSLSHAAVEEDLPPTRTSSLISRSSSTSQSNVASGGAGATNKQSARRAAQTDAELALLALETVRLIKLYYWSVVEHVRSTDGEEAWRAAHEMVQRFSTSAEDAQLHEEFGDVQPGEQREKPLIVLVWLRINVERMVKAKAIELTQLQVISELLNGLVAAYNGADKIDKTVLPLPYCQLLKIFQIFFVFTLPFVLAPHTKGWTPAIAAFTAVGFFGLDQVGVELEGPFGVDENDFPLLSMGHEMANDLDAMARTVSRSKMEARVQSYTLEESMGMARAADAVLGWASLPVETLAAEDSVISLGGGDVEPKE